MFKSILASLVGGLVLVLAASPLMAAQENHSKQYVVLVGISKYADQQIKPRPHAEDDAKALYDLLTSKDHLGVDPQHIRLLLGSADGTNSQAATHENILKAIRWGAKSAGKEDLLVFAYFGQGAPLGDRTCFFASDSTFKNRAKNAVAAVEIEEELKNLKSHRFCAFIDADYKGFDVGKDPAPELNLENWWKSQEYLGRHDDDEDNDGTVGRIVLYAANPKYSPLDLKDHGLFAEVLLKGLKGEADKDGYEPDGLVTVPELVKYLGDEYPKLARENGKTKEEKEQSYFLVGGRSCTFALTHNPKVWPKVEERLGKLAKLEENNILAKEVAEQGRNLLSRMPHLEAQQSLRKNYQKLVDGELSLDDFNKERNTILEGMKLPRSVAETFAQKIMKASLYVSNEYVKEVSLTKLVGWAVEGLYRAVDEKIPQDVKERLEKIKELGEEELLTLLTDVRERLGKREDLDKHKDIDHTLQQMLRNLDPYTTYIDPEMLERFRIDTQGHFSGIGIQIRIDPARDMLTVVTPIKGSPAYKAGLKTGDIITKITREVDSKGDRLDPPEVLSTKGMKLEDAVKKIKGQAQTKVKLTVEREGVEKAIDFEIERDEVEVETVLGYKRKTDDNWEYLVDADNKIAYVRLTGFGDHTTRDLAALLDQLSESGIKGLVLDLRFNPGGLLRSAEDISELFVGDGLIVKVRDRAGHEEAHYGRRSGKPKYLGFPMACLINGQSASGSEIVAACLQDHNRALLVGERSYGKGSVQNLVEFEKGRLKMTIASYWRPSGKNINKSSTAGKEEEEWGVSPNQEHALKLSPKERADLFLHLRDQEIIPRRDIPSKKETKAEFKDRQLQIALDYLRGQIKTASRAPVKKAG